MIANRVRPRRARPEEGAVAVEFALVLPILLMVVYGIIAFGIVFAQQLSLGNGARQGARAGVVPLADCKAIVDEVRSGASTIGLSPSDVTVVVKRGTHETSPAPQVKCDVGKGVSGSADKPCALSTAGDKLFVYASFDSEVTVPLVPLSKTMSLQGIGVFRCEFS